MKKHYFGVLNTSEFISKNEIEQKKILIDLKVYILGTSATKNEYFEKHIFSRGTNYPKFLGDDFSLDGKCYKLSDVFLNEVFQEWQNYFFSESLPKIKENLETLKLQVEISDDNFVFENKQTDLASYNIRLQHKLFRELHKTEFDDQEEHLVILKKYLALNWFDLSDYICGMGNLGSYNIQNEYWSYIYLGNRISYLNNLTTHIKAETKLLIPKSIAILNEIGFFNLPFYKELKTLKMKHKLVALVLDLDYERRSVLRSIEGNISVLNKDSNEDFKKFTSHTHKDVKAELFAILNSSKSIK